MKERWQRQLQVLSAIKDLTNSTIKDLTDYLLNDDNEIDVNIVSSSVRHYHKNRLLRRLEPHERPYNYTLSNQGQKQLDWLERGDYINYLV